MAGRYRMRTRLRTYLPGWLLNLGFLDKPAKDCGEHDWYNASDGEAHCYHCAVGRSPWPPAS